MMSEKANFSLLSFEHGFLNNYWGLTHQTLTICTKHVYGGNNVSEF